MTALSYPYELSVKRAFIAQHVLTVPNPEPPEDEIHSHQFTVEILLAGSTLGEYNYLVDINEVEAILADLIVRYRDTVLNDLPEFEGQNPSIEHFARVFGDRFARALIDETPEVLRIKIWEDESAWASHKRELQ